MFTFELSNPNWWTNVQLVETTPSVTIKQRSILCKTRENKMLVK